MLDHPLLVDAHDPLHVLVVGLCLCDVSRVDRYATTHILNNTAFTLTRPPGFARGRPVRNVSDRVHGVN